MLNHRRSRVYKGYGGEGGWVPSVDLLYYNECVL